MILQDSQIEGLSYSLFIPPFYLLLSAIFLICPSIQASIHIHVPSDDHLKNPHSCCSFRSISNLYINLYFSYRVSDPLVCLFTSIFPLKFSQAISLFCLSLTSKIFLSASTLMGCFHFYSISLMFLLILCPTQFRFCTQLAESRAIHNKVAISQVGFYPVYLKFRTFSENFHQTPVI